MEPLALAFGMLIRAYRLLVEIPEQFGFTFEATIGGNEPDRVLAGRDCGQFFEQTNRCLGSRTPQFIVRDKAVIAARGAGIVAADCRDGRAVRQVDGLRCSWIGLPPPAAAQGYAG